MDFFSIVAFMVLLYIRPQEWVPGLAGARPVLLCMAFAILATVFRPRGFNPKDLLRTPHDWVMYAFFAWLILTSPTPVAAFQNTKSLLVFYIVTVQALTSWERLERFLYVWAILILIVAGLAAASQFGFDPMGSQDLTLYKMKGRLSLNTSIFNNPNALGHSLVPLLPMLYYLFFWGRPIFTRELALILFALPLYVLYQTQSKGSYLCGGVTVLITTACGRPLLVQVALVLLAWQGGMQGLSMLPRMEGLERHRSDPGIQGRRFAFQYGLSVLQTRTMGVGYDRFVDAITRERHMRIASHSSYVQIGSELGKPGLFLYLGILWCCLRSLLSADCATVPEERIRRLMIAVIAAFMVSSWMVNFTYRAAFFVQAGVVAAFHRLILQQRKQATAPASTGTEPAGMTPAPQATPQDMHSDSAAAEHKAAERFDLPPEPVRDPNRLHPGPSTMAYAWNRLGLVDVAVSAMLLAFTIEFWHYLAFQW